MRNCTERSEPENCELTGGSCGRTRTEEELRFMLYAIDNTQNQAFWMTEDGRLFYVNDAACRTLGYSRAELLRMSVPDIDPTLPPEAFAKHWRNLRENGSKIFESVHRTKDGYLYPVEIRANFVVFDGKEYNCAFASDISQRKRAEEELRENEEKFRVLAETSPAAIIVYQQEKHLYINPQVTHLTGYTEPEFMKMRFWDWIHPEFRELVRERGLARQRGESVPSQYELKSLTKQGQEKWVFVSGGRIEYRGQPAGIVTMFDITDRKRMEEELRQAHDDLEQRVEERTQDLLITNEQLQHEISERKRAEERLQQKRQLLEDLNNDLERRVWAEVAKNREKDIILTHQHRQATLGEMLDHIAHQWKQPLNSISLLLQYMRDGWTGGKFTDGDIRDCVEKTLALVEHMTQTMDLFRNFHRSEKNLTVFSLKDSIDHALSFVAPALRYQGIEVETHADPDLTAIGYPNEYAQVLLNLFTNARDTFKERKVSKPVLKIAAFAENDRAVVAIQDNAGGIPDAIFDKIFDLYFTTKATKDGSGIGLYMSKAIIEKNMGGKLSAANIDGGAQFRIELGLPGC